MHLNPILPDKPLNTKPLNPLKPKHTIYYNPGTLSPKLENPEPSQTPSKKDNKAKVVRTEGPVS